MHDLAALPAFEESLRAHVRAAFPALDSGDVLLENAGGSQVPGVVIDAVRAYMTERYVQLGAGYERSNAATKTVDDAHRFVARLMGARDGQVVLGSSTTSLVHMIANAYAEVLRPDQEIVLAQTGHEANMGPWRNLEKRGLKLRTWTMNPADFQCSLEALDELLSEKTALVAFPHVSNLLGEVVDVPTITQRVHAAGARVFVDGVAFAPHRRMQVSDWNVDWYVYSTYKVYGPHMAALYGRDDALAELTGPNHFFIANDELPYKFELGGANHEGCAALLALEDYLAHLLESPSPVDASGFDRAFALMTALEVEPTRKLVDFLKSRDDVRIVGPDHAELSRVGTVSFVHDSKSSKSIAEGVIERGVAIRHGHMYAYDLCKGLGLDPDDGVVRISLVHYNTPAEIDRTIAALEVVL